LASSLGLALRCSPKQVDHYFCELLESKALMDHLEDWKISRPWLRDSTLVPGRRVVWYAAVRLLKPKLVVETGVHHGLGALVIISALKKNLEEGFEGRYIGTDIDPSAGSMISGDYSAWGTVLYGDSLRSLESLGQSIDIFINDSNHSADYELAEYFTIEHILSPNALVIGDNTHTSESLNLWSREKGRDFLLLYEKPKDHWYPGAAVGLSIPATKPAKSW